MSKRASFIAFLFGLVVGNKGLTIGWHLFYISLIVVCIIYNPIIKWFGI